MSEKIDLALGKDAAARTIRRDPPHLSLFFVVAIETSQLDLIAQLVDDGASMCW